MSKFSSQFGVGIKGTGFYVPDKVVSNHDLAKKVDTNHEWIVKRIGVHERRQASENELLADMGAKAAKEALASADMKPEEIDLIILSRVLPDHIDPATACKVQAMIGAKNAGAFDIHAGGCPGSVYSLSVGASLVASGGYKNVLVISGDIVSRSILDYEDRSTCCFFGDGMGAIVLSPVKKGKGLQSFVTKADGERYEACLIKAGGLAMPINDENINDKNLRHLRMNNKGVWEFATSVFPESIKEVAYEAGVKVDEIDWVIPHQANINIIKSSMEALGLSMDKTHTTIERYGNTTGASVFITLHEALEAGKIVENDKVALVSFGAGLAWSAALINWPSKSDFID